jgi:YVTN family beta-propeller protein
MTRKLNATRILISGLTLALAFGLISHPALAQQFITVNFPGATSTGIIGISHSNSSILVGGYTDASNVSHGFLFNRGSYTTIDFPGATETGPQDVNGLGQVVGFYVDANKVTHGFLLSGGTFSTVDFPGAINTDLTAITDSGEMAGGYLDQNNIGHIFLLSGNTFTVINIPGIPNTGTVAAFNDLGHLAGQNASTGDGFLFANGKVTTIDAPGCSNTFISDLNDSDQVTLDCAVSPFGAFLYSAGTFSPINVPSATSTFVTALSNTGVVAGQYTDSDGVLHGFVQTNGPYAYIGSTSITVLDTSTDLVLTTIPSVGIGTVPVAITPTQLYIANFAGNVVDVIDTSTNMLQTTIPVGREPNAVAVTPDGQFGYVANFMDNTVSVFSTATNAVVATVPVGLGPAGEIVTPNGALDYDYDSTANKISVINTSTNTVVTTFPLVKGTWLAFTPNGAFAYITISPSSTSQGSIEVLAVPSNTVVTTMSVGIDPVGVAITPDGHYAYVSNNGSNSVSVIDTASNTVITTVPVGHGPYPVSITSDGANVYVGNLTDSTLSVIQVATNTVIATIPVGSAPFGIAISPAPPTSQSITQPLSPTAPNTFNYGPHNFTVTYPPGTSFSGVNMTVVAAQATPASIQQRFAGTPFVNAVCIVYSGAGGNCVDYQATCTNSSGSQITCPSEPSPTIVTKSSFDTLQPITNPGFLTTPIGTNDWVNIFDSFFLQRIDPTMKGRTSGFSEFVAVDLGATNNQGAGAFEFLAPLQSKNERIFAVGTEIPVEFELTSLTNHGVKISDAIAGITVVMISDANGNPTSNLILEQPAAFTYSGGNYTYSLNTAGYVPGTYNITVYGNAFVAQQVEFTLPAPTSGARISTTLQSLTLNRSNQYVAVFKMTNTGTGAANGLTITASKLNSTASLTPLPISMGDLNPSSSVKVSLSFPASAGAPKGSGDITISESYAGGTSGGGFRVILP